MTIRPNKNKKCVLCFIPSEDISPSTARKTWQRVCFIANRMLVGVVYIKANSETGNKVIMGAELLYYVIEHTRKYEEEGRIGQKKMKIDF